MEQWLQILGVAFSWLLRGVFAWVIFRAALEFKRKQWNGGLWNKFEVVAGSCVFIPFAGVLLGGLANMTTGDLVYASEGTEVISFFLMLSLAGMTALGSKINS